MLAAGITGTGLYVPEEIRANDWFRKFDLLPFDALFDADEVKERRVCGECEMSSDMEAKALLDAVGNAGISIGDIDMILVGPTLRDQPMPGNASLVQYKAGAKNAAAIDVESACTSLLTQMTLAWGLIRSGMYHTVACIGSARWTPAADYSEKNCMFMGDGAAALIMQPVQAGRGILSTHLESDGRCWGAVGCNNRLPRALRDGAEPPEAGRPGAQVFFYIGRGDAGVEEIRRSGPVRTPDVALRALTKAGLTERDIDFLITHNPALALTEAWRKTLNVPADKTHLTFEKYGNMSAASIGANLHEANAMGKLRDDDVVVLCAPGAGFNYAAAVLRWGK